MSLADILAAGMVLVPIVYVSLLGLAKVGVGPLSSETSTASGSTTSLPRNVSIEHTEEVEYQTNPRRDRWKLHAVLGVFLLPFGWGIALLIYAFRVRKRPRYIVTDKRIIKESPDGVTSYEYDEISQVQAGARVLESLWNRGNVQFSIDNRKLITLGWMQNSENLASLIENHAS